MDSIDKVIILDFGVVVHRSINAIPMIMKNNPVGQGLAIFQQPPFLGLSMMLGWLNRVGVTSNSLIIVAQDSRNSWRKDFETEYKADRKKKREDSGIDFGHWYEEFNKLVTKLDSGTNWNFVASPRTEADDIMAVACRQFKDHEVILITIDADLEQMWEYPNVKIFTPMTKAWKLRPDNFDVNVFLSKKIRKETADNMTAELLTEADFENREKCVDLLHLPEWVEEAIKNELDLVGSKLHDTNLIPFPSLREKYLALGQDKTKVVSYEEQLNKVREKADRKKRKKEEAKAKIKRAKEREAKKIAKQIKEGLKEARKDTTQRMISNQILKG